MARRGSKLSASALLVVHFSEFLAADARPILACVPLVSGVTQRLNFGHVHGNKDRFVTLSADYGQGLIPILLSVGIRAIQFIAVGRTLLEQLPLLLCV